MISRAFRYRLYPTEEQAAKMAGVIGVCRFVYNLAWEQRRDWYRQFRDRTGRSINWSSQSREVTDLRREVDWIAASPRSSLEQALRDLDKAFANFFAGRAEFPSPRRKGVNESYREQGKDLRLHAISGRWGAVKLSNVGMVRYRSTRPVLGRIRNATISRSAGAWFISFSCEIHCDAASSTSGEVGIDRGISNTISLSTGEHFSIPSSLIAIDRRKRRAQRLASRGKRGSKRYRRAIGRVSRASARLTDARRDWLHRTSTDIARRFGLAAIEDLNIKGMTASGKRKRGLNRSILNQGWGAFAAMLTYKMEERGGTVVKVPAAYTSQTCSACGVVDRGSRESQASFRCRHCGHVAHADTNAAIEILRRSTALMRAEGSGYAPGETRTGGMSIHAENLALSA